MHYKTITDPDEWRNSLSQFPRYDFVHTFDFGHISKLNDEGDPILFSISSSTGECLCLWPALKKQIPETDLFDLGCVYGYGGPLVQPGLDERQCLMAFDTLFEGMKNEGYVSLFSRMHPLFTHELPKPLQGAPLGEIVIIDIDEREPEDILAGYRKTTRYDIRKARKNGVRLFIDQACEQLDDFVEIYQQTMRGMDADDFYLFDRSYFANMSNAKDFKAFLTFATYEGVKIGAGMSIVTTDIMQSYLGGSVFEYKRLSPDKTITAKEHEIAHSLGVTRYVLGGGVGLEDDSLLRFKKGFSEHTETFRVFKKIMDQETYNDLCMKKLGTASIDTNFFPEYRATADRDSKVPQKIHH